MQREATSMWAATDLEKAAHDLKFAMQVYNEADLEDVEELHDASLNLLKAARTVIDVAPDIIHGG